MQNQCFFLVCWYTYQPKDEEDGDDDDEDEDSNGKVEVVEEASEVEEAEESEESEEQAPLAPMAGWWFTQREFSPCHADPLYIYGDIMYRGINRNMIWVVEGPGILNSGQLLTVIPMAEIPLLQQLEAVHPAYPA